VSEMPGCLDAKMRLKAPKAPKQALKYLNISDTLFVDYGLDPFNSFASSSDLHVVEVRVHVPLVHLLHSPPSVPAHRDID
jgi:hypothetical protein